MLRRLLALAASLFVLLWLSAGQAAEPDVADLNDCDAARLARRIDARLAERWAAAGVRPAEPLDDAGYLRRVSLDLIGRIPTVQETRSYAADKSPDKRRKLVSRLLASPLYARHWGTLWRRRWIPEADTQQFEFLVDDVDDWLAAKLHKRVPYDRIVAELLNGPEGASKTPGDQAGARAFLVAGEEKPENLAAHATRAFLGINLDCAQCHDHPFARWTRDEFWQTAAFFARPEVAAGGMVQFAVTIPETDRRVTAKFLTAPSPEWPTAIDRDTGRRALAEWIVAPDNPFFARHAVNTIWLNLFGNGLVVPLDDLSVAAPEGDPKLLAELAEVLSKPGSQGGAYDVTRIVEACVLSQTYQLQHRGAAAKDGTVDELLFARSPVRALSGEQLYESIRTAAGLPALRDDLARHEALVERRSWGRQFLADRAAAAERSILQALKLMNGRTVTDAADPTFGPLLIAAVDGPFPSPEDRIDLIFTATLNRSPTDDERAAALAHWRSAGVADRRKAAADLFWALVNTAEFNTNH